MTRCYFFADSMRIKAFAPRLDEMMTTTNGALSLARE